MSCEGQPDELVVERRKSQRIESAITIVLSMLPHLIRRSSLSSLQCVVGNIEVMPEKRGCHICKVFHHARRWQHSTQE
jgi:hypothetical protein